MRIIEPYKDLLGVSRYSRPPQVNFQFWNRLTKIAAEKKRMGLMNFLS